MAHEQKTKESNNHHRNNRGSLFDLQVPAAPRYSFCHCVPSGESRVADGPVFKRSAQNTEIMGGESDAASVFQRFFVDIVGNWWKTGGTVGFFCG